MSLCCKVWTAAICIPLPPPRQKRTGATNLFCTKVAFRLWSYDPHMRSQTIRFLSITIFVALAVAFDYFSVAAIAKVGFDGVERLVLSLICLIVGTVSAFTLTRP